MGRLSVLRSASARPHCRHLLRSFHTQRPRCSSSSSSSTFTFDLSPSPLRILFFGSDHFSLRTLSLLTSPPLSSLPPSIGVVCPDAQPIGRGRSRQPLPVHTHAQQHRLPAFPVPDAVNFRMQGWEVPPCPWQGGWDVGVVVSFGYFIPHRVIRSFPLGLINLHPSLLPKSAPLPLISTAPLVPVRLAEFGCCDGAFRYRGASPIQHALLHDERQTGVSVIDLHPTRMDAGDILLQLTEVTAHSLLASHSRPYRLWSPHPPIPPLRV